MSEENLKVFISWSGDLSNAVARIWHEMIDTLFDNVTPWMSDKNIELGTRNMTMISSELKNTRFGIVVVTQENQNSQWLTFESGALSWNVDDPTTRLVPSLVDFKSPGDLTGPLSQFQAGVLGEEHVRQTLEAVANAVGADWLKKSEVFNALWGVKYKTKIETVLAKHQVKAVTTESRPQADKIDEMLTIVRDLQRTLPNEIKIAGQLRGSKQLNEHAQAVAIYLRDAGIIFQSVKPEPSPTGDHEILVQFASIDDVPSHETLESLQQLVSEVPDTTVCFHIKKPDGTIDQI